jgi:Rhamnan synthesis protein F
MSSTQPSFVHRIAARDIGQFLNCLPSIRADIICKVHTKKSAWAYGEAWRKELYRGTLGISPESVLAAFERGPTLGVLAPAGHLLPHRVWWERNVQLVTQLAGEIGATDNFLPFCFPAGAMLFRDPVRASVLCLGIIRKIHSFMSVRFHLKAPATRLHLHPRLLFTACGAMQRGVNSSFTIDVAERFSLQVMRFRSAPDLWIVRA